MQQVKEEYKNKQLALVGKYTDPSYLNKKLDKILKTMKI